MDVRAGLKEYWKRLTPTQKEARLENVFKGQRDAKKKAYAADEPARAARNEARAADERARAEARAAELQAAAPWARTLDKAEVVPPEAGATTYFVGVYWDKNPRSLSWRASYKRGKGPLHKFLKVPGQYPTNQRAARARYEYIRAEGLQQFNDMDALDDATDLMVPREKKPPKKRPVAAAPTRQSSRARKVSHAAEASAEQENMRF